MSSTAESLCESMLESLSLANNHPPSSNISLDLLSRILLLLPPKSLARSRCVCKSWNSFISSPNFIHLHISSARFQSDGLLVLSKLCRFAVDDDPLYHLYPPPSDAENARPRSLGMPHNPVEYGSFPIGVVHGVVCIFRIGGHLPKTRERSVILWNPVTRKQVRIPETLGLIVEGFGYDPLTKQLKVVATRKNRGSSQLEVAVVSHREKEWRMLSGAQCNHLGVDKDDMLLQGSDYDGCVNWLRYDDSNKGSVMFEHHYYEGHIHWLRYSQGGNRDGGWLLIAFDCAKDEFRYIELPEELVKCKPPRKLIWGPRGPERPDYDKLVATQCGAYLSVQHMESDSNSCNMHIWVMYEYGDPNSWMKLFTVPLMDGLMNVRMTWEDEEVSLWHVDFVDLTATDFTGTVVKRRIRHPNMVLDAHAFKESLLLMDT